VLAAERTFGGGGVICELAGSKYPKNSNHPYLLIKLPLQMTDLVEGNSVAAHSHLTALSQWR
jgi:hypothetical protein